jgi:hypothetical protein
MQTSKIFVAEKEIVSHPNVKEGKVLPPEKPAMVKQFYVSHEISRIIPRKTDVSVKPEGKKAYLKK